MIHHLFSKHTFALCATHMGIEKKQVHVALVAATATTLHSAYSLHLFFFI